MTTYNSFSTNNMYQSKIRDQMARCIVETDLPYPKYRGKVRDRYDCGDSLLLVTTDRLSAFDRSIASIPFKGQALNRTSAWWFDKTKHIVDNHLLTVPEPNQMQVKKCQVFPIEVVVRGYMTGTTSTSIWHLYQQGERTFFDTTLPSGLKKNTPLPHAILTPSTKAEDHDEPLTQQGLSQLDSVTNEQWTFIAESALALFAFGQQVASQSGLILVDTKYEFGLDEQGNILLVDECHTPDSSRYWLAETYQQRLANNQEPDNFDKEMLRLWYREHCDPYHDKVLPEAPQDLVIKLSQRYIEIFERLTGEVFFK